MIRPEDARIEQVEANADREWLARARAVVLDLADTMPVFGADDVWARMGDDTPREPRALGPVIKGLAREGVLEHAGHRHSDRRGGDEKAWRKAGTEPAPVGAPKPPKGADDYLRIERSGGAVLHAWHTPKGWLGRADGFERQAIDVGPLIRAWKAAR